MDTLRQVNNPEMNDILADQRANNIVVDNAYRPGKGSKPRPLAVSKAELNARLEQIFGWSRRRRVSGGSKKRTAPAILRGNQQ